MKNVTSGQAVEFTVSGTGSLPRDAQPTGGGGAAMGGQAADDSGAAAGGPNGKPGGGLGNPIDTPDPLSKYKYWILAGLAIILVVAAGFLLRKPAGQTAAAAPVPHTPSIHFPPASLISTTSKSQLLLDALKEEIFAIESEKIHGKLTPDEYAQQKAAIEIVLKRALERQKHS
jgi:hypothetical protein